MAKQLAKPDQGLPESTPLKEVFSIRLTDNIGRQLGVVETDGFPTNDQIEKAIDEAVNLHQLQVFAKVDKRYTK